jgi:hypothetical protein
MNEYERFLVSFLHNKWLGPNSLFPRTRISQWPKHLPGHLKYGLKKTKCEYPIFFFQGLRILPLRSGLVLYPFRQSRLLIGSNIVAYIAPFSERET